MKRLEYRVVMPEYGEAKSRYAWSLTVYRYNGEQVLVSASSDGQAPRTATSLPAGRLDYDPSTVQPKRTDEGGTRIFQGAIKLLPRGIGEHDIERAVLHLKFWPDINEADGFAELVRMEVR